MFRESQEPVINPESLSNRAERLVLDFLLGSEIGVLNVEPTTIFDRNDRDGIDAVAEVEGGGKIALDITFNGDEKLKEKKLRNLKNPCAYLHDENGRAIGESLPRVLIKEFSQVNWTTLAQEAERRGGKLIDVMGPVVARRKKVEILTQIVTQMRGFSRYDADYKERAKNILEIFEEKLEELGEAA